MIYQVAWVAIDRLLPPYNGVSLLVSNYYKKSIRYTFSLTLAIKGCELRYMILVRSQPFINALECDSGWWPTIVASGSPVIKGDVPFWFYIFPTFCFGQTMPIIRFSPSIPLVDRALVPFIFMQPINESSPKHTSTTSTASYVKSRVQIKRFRCS